MKVQAVIALFFALTSFAYSNTDREFGVEDVASSLKFLRVGQPDSVLENEFVTQNARRMLRSLEKGGYHLIRGEGSIEGTDTPTTSESMTAYLENSKGQGVSLSLSYQTTARADGLLETAVDYFNIERSSSLKPSPGASVHN